VPRTLRVALLVASFALPCAACGDREPASATQRRIVNGQPTTTHPSVGMLKIGGDGYCTATLVGERTLVSAGHCVVEQPKDSFDIVRYTFEMDRISVPVVKAKAHPDYDPGAELNASDIGIMRLAYAPPGERSAVSVVAPEVGQEVTLVGFGVTAETAEDEPLKRIGTNLIQWVKSQEIGWKTGKGSGSCYGDSGGPVFAVSNDQEVVVAVVSRGTGPCGYDDVDTRVDTFIDWLRTESEGDLFEGGAVSIAQAPLPKLGEEESLVSVPIPQPEQPHFVAPGAVELPPEAGGCSLAPAGGRPSAALMLSLLLCLGLALRRRR
jgi:secreted trypsin-like serine protease